MGHGPGYQQYCHRAQRFFISGILSTFPVLFSTRGPYFLTLQELEYHFTLPHILECKMDIIDLIKLSVFGDSECLFPMDLFLLKIATMTAIDSGETLFRFTRLN